LFNTEGSDLGDLAVEHFIGKRFDADAGRLGHVDIADIRLIDLSVDIHLVDVADGHDQRGGRAENENGAYRVADLDVSGEDHAVHWRGQGGVAELFIQLVEAGLV